jgi:hypothetical protein
MHEGDFMILENGKDVSPAVLKSVEDCLDFYWGDPTLPLEDFIDRLCTTYLNQDGIDIEEYDNPAVRKIMRHAREIRRSG